VESNITEFVVDAGSLYDHFTAIKDMRKKRGIRYSLPTILLLIVLAKLCGEDKPYGIADWVQSRKEMLLDVLQLGYPRLPHHTTYGRILDEHESEIDRVVSEYLGKLPQVEQEAVITLDGKTVCGTITQADRFGLHLLAAYLPGAGIVLKQLPVEKDKENEIGVAPQLLESLNLEEKVVVGDAMQTQRGLSSQIVDAGGDFVWIVKGNQPKTREAIERLFAPQKQMPGQGCPLMDFSTAQTIDKNHGRLEERTIMVSSLLNDYIDWPAVQQVFKLERRFTYENSNKVHHEIQYGLTSLNAGRANPEKLLEVVRSEWGIENGLHYRRDVTFQEDKTRMTRKNMAQAMACLNNLVIALFCKQGFTNHARARRILDANPLAALAIICRL
jgi:predicted transposase YbfD/YdcC